jgi:hypothetical protein
MHQVHISTKLVTSLAKKVRNQNKIVKTVKESKKMCHRIELNQLKEKVLQEGDNPSFETNL